MEQSKFYQIKNVTKHEYNLVGCDGSVITRPIRDIDKSASAFTIQDAKDGDVLAGKIDGDNYILIFKQIKDGWVETYGHYYDAVDRFCVPSQLFCRDYKGTFHPATKEQRDALFAKMQKAGYEWDAEKKELKKISQRMISAEAKEAMYDKPTDNDMVEALRMEYEKGRADAFAEMEKPTWSVEDMSKVQRICKYLDEAKKYYADITEVRECMDWLKSLKDRYTWKPSKKQMEILQYLCETSSHPNEKVIPTLESLYQDLKKLREG